MGDAAQDVIASEAPPVTSTGASSGLVGGLGSTLSGWFWAAYGGIKSLGSTIGSTTYELVCYEDEATGRCFLRVSFWDFPRKLVIVSGHLLCLGTGLALLAVAFQVRKMVTMGDVFQFVYRIRDRINIQIGGWRKTRKIILAATSICGSLFVIVALNYFGFFGFVGDCASTLYLFATGTYRVILVEEDSADFYE